MIAAALIVALTSVEASAFTSLKPGWVPSVLPAAVAVDAAFTGKAGPDIAPADCAAVAAVSPSAIGGRDFTAFARLRAECAAACVIARAAPARFDRARIVVTVRGLRLAELPPMVAKGMTSAQARQTLGARATVRRMRGGVSADLHGETVTATPLAFGDFDGNGVGDVLLLTEDHLGGGSYVAYGLVAASPRGKRPAHIAWRWDGTVCGVPAPAAPRS